MKSITLDNILHQYDGWHDVCDENDFVLISLTKEMCYSESHVLHKTTEKRNYSDETKKYKKVVHCNSLYDNIKVKHYIKTGEICPVCFDEIWSARDGFLTDCGHAFHKKCINQYANVQLDSFSCPICRYDTLDASLLINTYHTKNYLDKLDDFWMNTDLLFPELCSDYRHHIGMKNDCKTCLNYRKNGRKTLYI